MPVMRLALRLSPDAARLYRAAGKRVRGVEWVETEDTTAEACIADDLETAREAGVRGVPLLWCDPDLSVTEEVEAIYGEDAANLVTAAHVWRYQASRRAIVARLREGKLGQPGLLRIHRWEPRGDAVFDSTRILPEMDLAHWIFREAPTVIHALPGSAGSGSYLQAHLGFARGGMALIDYAFCLPSGSRYDSLSVIGSTGAAYADDHRNCNLLYQGDDPAAFCVDEKPVLAFQGQLESFVSAVRAGKAPPVSLGETKAAWHTACVALDKAGMTNGINMNRSARQHD